MSKPPTFAAVSHILVAHSGRFFRFKRATDHTLNCTVCYWTGSVLPPKNDSQLYQAFVEQKYTPYEKFWADKLFTTEEAALNWVASQLVKRDQDKPDS